MLPIFARTATTNIKLKVVDACALAAILFAEAEATYVLEQLDGANLLASDLLDFEIANIAVKKWRKKDLHYGQLQNALRAREDIAVTLLKVDYEASFNLAIQADLTAYDASYLWLARHYHAELVTLDIKLQSAFLSDIGR